MVRAFLLLIACILGVIAPWLVEDWLEHKDRLDRGLSSGTVAATWVEDAARSWWGLDENADTAEMRELFDAESTATPIDGWELDLKQMAAVRNFRPIGGASASEPRTAMKAIPRTNASEQATARHQSSLDRSMRSKGYRLGSPIFLRLFKEEKTLEVWAAATTQHHFQLVNSYPIRAYSGKLGPKMREGDGQLPEGFYFISANRLQPDTRHHLGLDLGYPNRYDVYHSRTGSKLWIHGGSSSQGAFALDPAHMEEVYALAQAALSNGQRYFRVHVFPFKMTDHRTEQACRQLPKWAPFWSNLKEGYDFFEIVNRPPDVQLINGRYGFRFSR